jgi:hypothetical protein
MKKKIPNEHSSEALALKTRFAELGLKKQSTFYSVYKDTTILRNEAEDFEYQINVELDENSRIITFHEDLLYANEAHQRDNSTSAVRGYRNVGGEKALANYMAFLLSKHENIAGVDYQNIIAARWLYNHIYNTGTGLDKRRTFYSYADCLGLSLATENDIDLMIDALKREVPIDEILERDEALPLSLAFQIYPVMGKSMRIYPDDYYAI